MQGAYGRIVDVYPHGRSLTNPTPVFEVEADWPSGMSGGPVFNRRGEVVGMVSRSLRARDDAVGAGFAVHFEVAQDMAPFLVALDADNPGWRYCWGLISVQSHQIVRAYPTRKAAEGAQATFEEEVVLLKLSHKLGSDEYMDASSGPY